MEIIKFQDVELHLDNHKTLSTAEVAKGYGTSADAIRLQKKRHQDEILKNIHYIEVWDDKFKRYITRWTLEGVHMLGFFIKSERAKEFRKFTAKLLTEIKKGNVQVLQTQQQIMLPENFDTRISGYKGQLARRKKEIEKLRLELALCKEELKKCQAEHSDANLWREEAKTQKERADKNQELMEHFRQMAGFQVYKIGVIYDAVDELKEIRSQLTDTPKAYHIVSKVMNILNTHIKKADEYTRFLQIPPLVKKIN